MENARMHVQGILQDLTVKLMQLQGDLLKADSRKELKTVLVNAHDSITEANAGFAALVDATKDWK